VTMSIPAGTAVDALVAVEDLSDGQAIARYAVHVQRGNGGPWAPVDGGVHGQTVGTMVVDVLSQPVVGPATLRWSCLASLPNGTAVKLESWTAHKLRPPPGWAPPSVTKWALQTLYTPVAEDMTPCATRGADEVGVGVAANRSSCAAYMSKVNAKYAYVRDEHCCYGSSALGGATVPLYLLYSGVNNDHLVSSNASFSQGGAAYSHDSIECYGFSSLQPGTAPLDLYWSEARRDTWSLSSNASRSQALELGYVYIGTTAFIPTDC
jgi:hypothetical protein